MPRPIPPTGEAPLLCEDCNDGCLGHEDRCSTASCECLARPGHIPRRYRSLESRWVAMKNSGRLAEDASLIAAGLRVAAEQYDRDAEASADTPRVRQQFRDQANRSRIISEAIEP